MGKSKKLIAAMFVFMAALLCLYSQSNNQSETQNQINNEQNISLSEDSIILEDSSASDSSDNDFKGTSTVGVFVRMIVVLVIVVALIYGILWFIKKKTNVVKTDDDYLRRVAYINIAPGKTVEVITLIDKAYLIGVTEDNISLLGEIEDKELIQAMNLNADKKNNTKKPVNFAQVLDTFLVKGNRQKNVFSDEEEKVDQIFNQSQKESE
ncbi:MAG: flagellar biosynthetic protein FliO [Treponema sp.]|nr:flagellar biosynthetic protein FliO [Treponema sp.]